MTMKDLLEKRARIVSDMRAIADKPEGDGGDLSDDQAKRFDTLKTDLASVEQRIERQAILDEADRRAEGRPLPGGGDSDWNRAVGGFSLRRAIASQLPDFREDAGREREVSAELAKRAGRAVEGIMVPFEALIPTERRVLTVAGDGSNLVQTTVLENEFIDALRPSSVTVRLGARTITGLRGDIALPKMDALTPAAAWVAENSALTPGDHSFTQVTGAPHHLGALTEYSRKLLLQSSPEIETIVRNDFTAKLGAGIDLGVMKGSGSSGQPTGITQSSPQTKDQSSAAPAWADVVEVETLVEAADVPQASLGWALNAWVKRKLRTTQKVTGEAKFLMDAPDMMGGAPVAVTSQLAGNLTGPVDGEAIFGAWNQVIVAFWTGVEILVNPYESTAYSKGNVQVRGFVDADVLLRHALAFVHWSAIKVDDA